MDRATPNLPSRDFTATTKFYAKLGFREQFRDNGWLILERGTIQIEFFPWPELELKKNMASCCIRVADANALYESFRGAHLPESCSAVPRITAPVDQPWGLCEFAIIDPDGNLLRCLSPVRGG